MSLTRQEIRRTTSDSALLEKLKRELRRVLPQGTAVQAEGFRSIISRLPKGLRAMAYTYLLDESLAVDDLAWHFLNWHRHGDAQDTIRALRELGAGKAADIFQAAYDVVRPHWKDLERHDFADWYRASGLEKSLEPFNRQLMMISREAGEFGLMSYWPTYARRNPELVVAG